MTHTIEVTDVPDDLLQWLDERVRELGGDRSAYIRKLLLRDLHSSESIDETVAAFRTQVEASGITDDEFDQLVETARQAAFEERRARAS